MKWGRVVAGAVGAGAGALTSLASRYIDEELMQQRAQALADIQRENSLRTERELDAQRNTPERLARDREKARQDLLATDRATRESFIEGINNPAFQGAKDSESLLSTRRRIKAENEVTEGTKGAKLTAETERIQTLLPYEKERAAALADIQASRQIRVAEAVSEGQMRREEARAERSMQAKIGPDGKPIKISEAAKLELQNLDKQTQELQKQINEGVAGGMLKPDPNDPAFKHLQRSAQALQVQKLRVYARENLINGGEAAQELIAAGASDAELQASKQQAQLIGGNYAKEFASAIAGRKTPAASAPGGPGRAASSPRADAPAPSSGQDYRALVAEYIAKASDRQLRTWASSKGHTHQQQALEELQRRQARKSDLQLQYDEQGFISAYQD